MRRFIKGLTAIVAALALASMLPAPALAWGDEGHEVIALITQEHLDPLVRKKVRALLAADTDDLTAHDSARKLDQP